MKDQLINEAKQAREKAYAPYSKFLVGAAVLSQSGNIYTGCNIENSSYSLTCCAERVALFKAISAGERNFTGMAIIADTESLISPCGACRQVMREFITDDTPIYLSNLTDHVKMVFMNDLLPEAFNAHHLNES